ncbi:MAG TPA: DUF1488 family protein [Caulifigura sp.]|jgi:hypothetical protein|nr:DUF1488 family protein [Caulifigura sp.]
MPHRISFFAYSEWDSDRECVAFIALVDGLRARCLIGAETLFTLAREQIEAPLPTFLRHRETVEQLARRLIVEERLDGRELLIRLSDVPAVKVEPQPRSEAEVVADPVLTGDASLDGRQMTMPDKARTSVWRALCDRQIDHCEELFHNEPHVAGHAARREVGSFATLPEPATAHELNVRRIEATTMTASWRRRISDSHRTSRVSPESFDIGSSSR